MADAEVICRFTCDICGIVDEATDLVSVYPSYHAEIPRHYLPAGWRFIANKLVCTNHAVRYCLDEETPRAQEFFEPAVTKAEREGFVHA